MIKAVASSNSPVCERGKLHLHGGPNGMDKYYWKGPNGFKSNQQSPIIHEATTSMTGRYTLQIIKNGIQSKVASIDVIVQALPKAFPNSNSPIKEGQTLKLKGGPDGMDNYVWDGPGEWRSTDQNPERKRATGEMAGNYNLIVVKNGSTSEPAIHYAVVNAKYNVFTRAIETILHNALGGIVAGIFVAIILSSFCNKPILTDGNIRKEIIFDFENFGSISNACTLSCSRTQIDCKRVSPAQLEENKYGLKLKMFKNDSNVQAILLECRNYCNLYYDQYVEQISERILLCIEFWVGPSRHGEEASYFHIGLSDDANLLNELNIICQENLVSAGPLSIDMEKMGYDTRMYSKKLLMSCFDISANEGFDFNDVKYMLFYIESNAPEGEYELWLDEMYIEREIKHSNIRATVQ